MAFTPSHTLANISTLLEITFPQTNTKENLTAVQLTSGLADNLETFNRALTVAEIADHLNTSTMNVYRMVKRCVIPHFRIGDSIRFDPKAVASWLRRISTSVA